MLARLFIQNLATVEKQVIEFEDGFTALTGETGAGKSIVVKAIQLVLGEKCPKDLIRGGEEYLVVEAVFTVRDIPEVQAWLQTLDLEPDGELSIRRKVHMNGRSSLFVNDYTLKLNQLSELGRHLIDLHGQHAQQALLQPATHIDYLDQFAGLGEKVRLYQLDYQQLNRCRSVKRELLDSAAERRRKIDFIRFQIDEIEKAAFTELEEQQLNDDFQLLSHGEQLVEALAPIAEWNSTSPSPLSEISGALQRLQSLTKVAPEVTRFAAELQSGLITLEEAVVDMNRYLSRLDVNPERLEAVNERLAQLDQLKRKYGGSLAEVLSFKEARQRELAALEELENNHDQLDQEIYRLTQKVKEQAEALSRERSIQAEAFERLVQSNLQELGLERSRFKIDLMSLPLDDEGIQTVNAKGRDRVEFLITTNPGQPLKPLARVASGGEISRIMLAVKTSLNEDLTRGTMVFDEVDAGISGRVADSVGIKLDRLGTNRQIICITHSPQIAAKARHHFRVEKVFQDNTAKTLISALAGEERVEEIARFLGGDKISVKTLSVAREMLRRAVP